MNNSSMTEMVLELMDRGADIIRIGKAAEKSGITIEQMEHLHQENGLNFEYKRSTDILTIRKDQE